MRYRSILLGPLAHAGINLVHSYYIQEIDVDNADPCMGILAVADFVILSTGYKLFRKCMCNVTRCWEAYNIMEFKLEK